MGASRVNHKKEIPMAVMERKSSCLLKLVVSLHLFDLFGAISTIIHRCAILVLGAGYFS